MDHYVNESSVDNIYFDKYVDPLMDYYVNEWI